MGANKIAEQCLSSFGSCKKQKHDCGISRKNAHLYTVYIHTLLIDFEIRLTRTRTNNAFGGKQHFARPQTEIKLFII